MEKVTETISKLEEILRKERSKRQALETSLRNSEQRLERVRQGARLCIWEFDMSSGSLVYHQDERIERLFTDNSGSVTLKALINQIVHPEDRKAAEDAISEALSTGVYHPFEYKSVGQGGLERYMRCEGKIVHDERGTATTLHLIHLDITDRKKCESDLYLSKEQFENSYNNLKQSEEKYRLLFNTSNDFIFLHPLVTGENPGIFIEVNDLVCKTLGYSREELRKLSPVDIIGDPDKQEITKESDQLQQDGELLFEKELISKSGQRIPVELHAQVFDYHGRKTVLSIGRDITERKQLENSLVKNEQLLREILDNMEKAIAVYEAIDDGKDFKIVEMNEFAETITEIRSQDIIGKTILEAFPEADSIGVLEKLAETYRTGQSTYVPLKQYKDNRITVWVENYIYKLPSGRVVAMFEDTYAQRNAEDQLKKSEENLKIAQQIAQMGSWTWHCQTDAFQFSPPTFQLFGCQPEAIRSGINSYLERIHEEDRERVKEQINRAVEQNEPYENEHRIIRDDGSIRIHYTKASIEKDENGQSLVMSGVVQDITERKQAEELLNIKDEAIANAIDAIILTDPSMNVTYVNQAFLEMWGFDDPSEVMGCNVVGFLGPEEEITTVMDQLREESSWIGEIMPIKKDGSRFHAQVSATQINDENGNPICLMGSFEEISKRKQDEEKIKQALKEKKTLLQEIHHRVKNNMQVISSLINLQASSIEDEKVKEALIESQNRVYAMSALHEALYGSEHLAKIELEAYLSRIVQALMKSYRIDLTKVQFDIESDDIHLDMESASPLGLTINELISNALKHAFPGDRTGEINIRAWRLEDKSIQLTVKDNGIGISPETDWKDSRSLGLRLVRDLIEQQLSGSIELNQDQGTTFTIRFNPDS